MEKVTASLARTNSQPTTGACTMDKGSLARSPARFNRLQLRPTPKHLGPTALLHSSSRDRGTVGTAMVPQEDYEGHFGKRRIEKFCQRRRPERAGPPCSVTGASHCFDYSQLCYVLCYQHHHCPFRLYHLWERYSGELILEIFDHSLM